ncbi:MAG: hypothetical protein U9R00_00385 [Patescibacteria group bacterium]|nr:hypothetical protein [Patescibacteria group bacterium]
MNSETKNCQNCKKDFVIESEDFDFYKKMKVPAPTFCPKCRLVRRLAARNERVLYKNNCDLCKKEVVTTFSKDSPHITYCASCWWGDEWDPISYGQEYDFSKPFFEQLYELKKRVPFQVARFRNSINCSYSNGAVYCKNCVSIYSGIQSVNCYYCQSPLFSKDSIDSDVLLNAERAYQTVSCNGVYNTKFVYFSDECISSSFLFNCIGCSDCIGCVNLRNKKYCIFNKQYSKEDYKKEIKKWDLSSYKKTKEVEEKFWELYYKTPRRFAIINKAVNVSGDSIKNAKNCKNCFVVLDGIENCKNLFLCALLLKDSHDITLAGDNSSLNYYSMGNTEAHNVKFTDGSNNVINVEYCEQIYSGKNLFGCVGLRNKKYCILNKQYTKEKYEELIPKIKQHMNKMPYVSETGIVYKYGEYIPIEHGLWSYNETLAQQWFPLSKKEVLEKGYKWKEKEDKNYKIDIKSKDIPDNIEDVTDDILDKVIECEGGYDQVCTKAFKILPDELKLYRAMKVALPRKCPNCRFYKRLSIRNKPELYHRKCMKKGCDNEFETPISKDRKEIVYCKDCYQKEFI